MKKRKKLFIEELEVRHSSSPLFISPIDLVPIKPIITTDALGEEGGGPIDVVTTQAIGEEGGHHVTTFAIGEEGGF